LYVPEVAKMEWVALAIKDVTSNLESIEQSSMKIGRVLGREPLEYKQLTEIPEKVNQVLMELLNDTEIKIVPTPEIDLEKLINMAVQKIPPFEEKKEKGFRDAVILFTMLEHSKTDNFNKAMFVTQDSIFENPEVTSLLANEGLNIQIAKNISMVLDLLVDQIEEADTLREQDVKLKVKDFLNKNSETIFSFVLEKAQISKSFIEGNIFAPRSDLPAGTFVKRIVSVKPESINDVYLGLKYSRDEAPEGKYGVTFSVLTEFELIVKQHGFNFWFNEPKVGITEPVDFDRVPFEAATPKEFTTRITREITVEAIFSVKNGALADLELTKILTY
ncbi:DUF4935 domain-containing protein, partial [candidate division KSB1 bacterium]|nr:DUF4935 domain-containing protein [candidate division KSB1 bacterium]